MELLVATGLITAVLRSSSHQCLSQSMKRSIDLATDTVDLDHPRHHLRVTPLPAELVLSHTVGAVSSDSHDLLGTLGTVDLEVRLIPAAASYPLRQAVLRPHLGIDSVVWEGDEAPGTATFGAIDRATGAIVGVATAFPERAPFDLAVSGLCSVVERESATWRLRGMATREDLRGSGIGTRVLDSVLDYVAAEGGLLIWCNARVSAVGFYERAGFSTWGDEWVLPTVGPHVVMWRRIEAERVK
jgi:GNAT superfamily N-acetyltransferase